MTDEIRKLPTVEKRVETGPVQFGDDWPGVFIRGDDAAFFAMSLHNALKVSSGMPPPCQLALKGLLETLAGCIVGPRSRDEAAAP